MANASIDICAEDRAPAPASQRVLLSRWRAARDSQRKIDVGDLERPVVASLASGPFPLPSGEPYAEVEMIPCPDARFPEARVVASEIDTAAEFELCQTAVWSGRPTSAAAAVALRTELPAATCLLTADDADASPIRLAAPRELFILPSAYSAQKIDWPLLAPGALVTRVGSGAGESTRHLESAGEARGADADLAEFVVALARARAKGEPS
jgi:hypothetical protein